MKKKIAVLVSGGVDSSVTLALLKQQGHDLHAFYLKIWLEDELSYLGTCPWQEDLDYVTAVCKQLNVPVQVIPMQQMYHDRVVSYIIKEIKAGRTPNPDILCNQFVKFGAFYDVIDSSFDYVATGHYAQIEHGPDISILKKGNDPVKDQTYFLSNLSQAQLRRALFPIGHLPKAQVRALAEQFHLPTAKRKDSQGICFLGKFNFSEFVQAHLGNKPGDIIEFETGKKLGTHQGFWFYTIGQRQGIGLSGGPWYVVSKDVEKNIVYISNRYQDVDVHKHGMIVSNFNWNQGYMCLKTELDVRFRHGAAVHPSTLESYSKNGSGKVGPLDVKLKIMLKAESSQGIAAGQFAVLYDGDVCLGGGVIDQAF
ncbi:tRNA 2-thiouridine(34) synthase MnmA [Candidatus Dependentiae bacterium]|nr:tRNA 2-thiouridine(34) synthase MnmA [Candidatus Dependentiae bacterium]